MGGAGRAYPLLGLLVNLLAAAAAAYFILRAPWPAMWGKARFPLVLLGGLLLLPLLQLIPLPPELWHRLPGRQSTAELDALLGWRVWRPLTFDVEATVAAWVSLLPAAAMFVGSLCLPFRDRARLLNIVVGFAAAGALLGIAQVASAGGLTPYASAHTGNAVGLFVNRNHNAVLMLASIPLAGALAARQVRRGSPPASTLMLACAVIVVLALAVVGTTSRTGLALLPLSVAASLALLFLRQPLWRLVLPSVVAIGLVSLAVLRSGALDRTLHRFSNAHDGRFDYWADLSWAVQHFGLAGTGFGSFVRVYQASESLGNVSDKFLNHAHNDYIEIALEGGWAGIALLMSFAALLAWSAARQMRVQQSTTTVLTKVAAATAILVILIFSAVDYPLRMPAIGCLFALLCAIALVPEPVADGTGKTDKPLLEDLRHRAAHRMSGAKMLGLGAVALMSAVAVADGLSARFLNGGASAAAAAVAPWSTEAREQLSNGALLRLDLATAAREGRATLRLSPMSAPAVRTVAMTIAAAGDRSRGSKLMENATRLSWRDPIAQMWALETAVRSGSTETGLRAAESLLRQKRYPAPALPLLFQSAASPKLIPLLVQRLAGQPEWRQEFMRLASEAQPADLRGYERIIAGLAATRAPVTSREAEPLIKRAIALDQDDSGQRIWSLVRGARLVANGDFNAVDDRAELSLPAEWDVTPENHGHVLISGPAFDPANRAVFASGTRGSGHLISQVLMLRPGAYAFSFRTYLVRRYDPRLRWDLTCKRSRQRQSVEFRPVRSSGWQQLTAVFRVPADGCAVQRIGISRIGDTPQLWIDDVRLQQTAP
ncbi:MAG: O-antigen ligase family protein [Sphingomicrobium sp.]